MKPVFRSLFTALVISAAVVLFAVEVVAPTLPPFVGPPDVRESKQLNLPAAKKLRIVNSDGPIRVDTHPAGSKAGIEVLADVRAYVREDGDLEEAQEYAKSLVTAQANEDVVELVTEPAQRPNGLEILAAYVITVPQGTDIEVRGPNGNVAIAQGCGAVSVQGGNSDIEIVQPSGIVTAKSDNGRISLVDARNDARLEAVNGSIFANMQEGALEASTTNGHIVARLLSSNIDLCNLDTQNGSITVVLTPDAPFTYDALTDRGIIRSDFPLTDSRVGVQATKHVQGTVGDGGPVLTLETLNGNIWFKRKRS